MSDRVGILETNWPAFVEIPVIERLRRRPAAAAMIPSATTTISHALSSSVFSAVCVGAGARPLGLRLIAWRCSTGKDFMHWRADVGPYPSWRRGPPSTFQPARESAA